MVMPHWSGRNSTMVTWWCLIGQDVIPWPLLVGVHGGASWSGHNSTRIHGGASLYNLVRIQVRIAS